MLSGTLDVSCKTFGKLRWSYMMFFKITFDTPVVCQYRGQCSQFINLKRGVLGVISANLGRLEEAVNGNSLH